MNLRCIIVDDEPLAREGLDRLAREAGFLDVVALCADAMEANRILNKEQVDLLFLDIQMPRLGGLDFLRTLRVRPQVIVTTAYPDYALEGFDLQVLDYLLKPITLERFLKAVNRAREALSSGANVPSGSQVLQPPEDKDDYFFIKTGSGYEKINFQELLFIEAAQNYCALHTSRGKFLTLSPIHLLEGRLPPGRFLRVQKSFVISVEKITSVTISEVTLGNHRIPVSKSYRDTLLALVDKKLLRK